MNEIKKFYFRDQKVRGLLREGEPWFVAKDVCSVLDIGKYRDAISTLDDDESMKFLYGFYFKLRQRV